MKKSIFVFGGCALLATSLFAGPVVREGSVKLERVGETYVYRLSYTIDNEPAMVTVDVKQDGVSIGAENFQALTAAVQQNVSQVGENTVEWNPKQDWPGSRTATVTVEVKAWATNNPPDYVVFSFDSKTPPMYYASTDAIPHWGENYNRLYKTDKMVMRKIPAAGVKWRMGSPKYEASRNATREVPHYVTLTEDFYIGVYECTQEQYHNLANSYGGDAFKAYDDYIYRPCGKIPYYVLRGGTGKGIDWPTTGSTVADNSTIGMFRKYAKCPFIDLPTDAQWEFACRAGEGAALYNGKEQLASTAQTGIAPDLYNLGWYGNNCADDTIDGVAQSHEVGKKEPNAFGLYDMYGNVCEWVLDWDSWGDNYSDGSAVVDPKGATTYQQHKQRICRGGCYNYSATECRSATRMRGNDESSWEERFGFRFAARALIAR